MKTRRAISCVFLLSLALAAGCVSDGPPAPPPPRPVPAQPAGVKVDRLLATAAQIPEDTDRNGYYDQVVITIYLFDNQYTTAPIDIPGAFTFRLTDTKGKLLAEWTFDQSRTAAARLRSMVGPGFQFTLNMLDVGTDRVPAGEGQLLSIFTPAGGEPVQPRAGLTILVGPTR